MKYFDFNPTKIEKWERLARIAQPVSGSHYFFRWLGFPSGYRADTYSESQLDNSVVAERGLDGARTNPHIPHTPDDGEHYFQSTLALGETGTAYDANLLEQEGLLQHHLTFNINPEAERHHPLTLLFPTAREHVHELLVAALKASDCCHREPTLIQRVLTLMHTAHNTTDDHKGVLAAGV